MEKEEKTFIEKNKYDLMKLITCTNSLLVQLQQNGILGSADIEAINICNGNSSKSIKLLDTIQTRGNDAYNKLASALKDEHQSGASQLLISLKSTVFPRTHKPVVFKSLPNPLCHLLETDRSQSKNIILISYDVSISKDRILKCLSDGEIELNNSKDLANSVPDFKNIFDIGVPGFYGFDKFYNNVVICSVNYENSIKKNKDWQICREEFKWNDLTDTYQTLLMNRQILLQGQQLTLNYVCELAEPDKSRKLDLLANLETEFLVRLMKKQVPEITNIKESNGLKFYIPRRLIPRQRISRKVLHETKFSRDCDVFVFQCEGLRLFEFSSFIEKYGDNLCDSSGAQVHRQSLNVKSILLDTFADFEKVCNRALKDTNGPAAVHLLECVRDSEKEDEIRELKWIQSAGPVSTLRKYIHQEQTEFDEATLCDITKDDTTTVLVCDSAGTGKSQLLLSCRKKILETRKEGSINLVQYIVFKEFVDKLNSFRQTKGQVVIEDIVEVLVDMFSECTLGKSFMKSILQSAHTRHLDQSSTSNIRLEVMIDEIDELDSEMLKVALHALQVLTKTKFVFHFRVWVASRPNLLHELENCMEVLGCKIAPLNADNQIDLLTTYWTIDKQFSDDMRKVAEYCLENLKDKILTTKGDDHVAGIPLLCTLIADIYKEEAVNVCICNQGGGINSTDTFYRRIADVTIPKIYEDYIEKQFLNHHIEESGFKDMLYAEHMERALKVLFPDIDVAGMFTGVNKLDENVLVRYGILEKCTVTNQLKFVHLTFAEYFSARAILCVIKSDLKGTPKIFYDLLTKALAVEGVTICISKIAKYRIKSFRFRHPNLCYFLNSAIIYDADKNAIDKVFTEFVDSQTFAVSIWKRLLAAVTLNNVNIAFSLISTFKYILPANEDWECIFKSSLEKSFLDLILLSAKFAGKELMGEINMFSLDWTSRDLTKYQLVNGDAVIENSCLREENLTNTNGHLTNDTENLTPESENSSSSEILDLDSESSSDSDTDSVTSGSKNFSENRNIGLENENIHFNFCVTPLHVSFEAGNYSATQYLLSNKIFTGLRRDTKYRHLLHWCVLNSRDDLDIVIEGKKDIIRLFAYSVKDFFINNPLNRHILLEKIHLDLMLTYLEEVANAEKLHKLVFKINIINEHYENVLHLLARGHYDELMTPEKYHKALTALENHGFDICDLLSQRNALAWCAADAAIGLIDLFDKTFDIFDKCAIDYKGPDFRKCTSLYKAVAGQREADYLQRLIDRGVTWQRKLHDDTILHVAAAFYNFSAVKLFIQKGVQVNAQDDNGNTPLHMCFRKEAETMREKNGFNLTQSTGAAYLKSLTYESTIKRVDPIMRHYRKDSETNTFSQNEHTKDLKNEKVISIGQVEPEPSNQHKIIQHLIDNGADIRIPNNEGMTPLDLALEICLGGLKGKERDILLGTRYNLFVLPCQQKNMTLALKGLLLNTKIGHKWHPSLISSFAKKLREHGGDINLKGRNGSSLLHMASKRHSFYGIKYLVEVADFSVFIKDKDRLTPVEYMPCWNTRICKKFNCVLIKDFLRKKRIEST